MTVSTAALEMVRTRAWRRLHDQIAAAQIPVVTTMPSNTILGSAPDYDRLIEEARRKASTPGSLPISGPLTPAVSVPMPSMASTLRQAGATIDKVKPTAADKPIHEMTLADYRRGIANMKTVSWGG